MNDKKLNLRLHAFELPLKHAFGISRRTHSVQESLVVELSDGRVRGFGEAVAVPYYGMSLSRIYNAVNGVREVVESLDWQHPSDFWNEIAGKLKGEAFALCAIDQAVHDLWGKQAQRPTHEMLGFSFGAEPLSSFTIGIDSIEKMVSKLNEEPDWPIYKIKLGTQQDLEIVTELRKHSDSVFRVDANCGWTAETAISNSKVLADLGVEFIEQPLPASDIEGSKRVFQESALPVIADESCQVPSDVQRCFNCFHGVNIKLVKCGGMTPAIAMIQNAKDLGMKVMIGCMTESSVGISAIAQLLPLLDYVDIDGANLLAGDIAQGVRVINGRCEFSSASGNGLVMVDLAQSVPCQ
ncbi:dipeptide epimerase [bacterium]|nr:dipeptide epimerase [bacterium]MDB4338772.1 dipeptide epimerase [Rubripirellula sp.]